jgi:hypothetical protein
MGWAGPTIEQEARMAEAAPSTLLHDDAWRVELGSGRETPAERRPQLAAAQPDMIRAARENVGQLLVLLALVIALQIYTLALSSVMKSIETLGRDLHATEEELRQLAAAKAGDQSPVLQTTYARFGTLQRSYQASQLILVRLATPWHWIFVPGTDELERTVKDALDQDAMHAAIRDQSSDQGGRVMLQALALYLLPLLYGLLGANAFVLRALGQPTENGSAKLDHFRLRLALGALLGATVGLFFSADTPIAGTTLSLVAIAFLAGYSAEFFFALVDFLINKARDSFQPDAAPTPTKAPSTASVSAAPAG